MIARAWKRAIWAAESPYNLAGARVVVAAQALWVLLSRDLAAASGLPEPFWRGVSEITRWRYLLFPANAELEHVIQWIAAGALCALLVGWEARVSALVAALTLYHLAPLETIYWTASAYERGFEVAILALVVLSASPCGAVWSVDALRGSGPPSPSPDFGWPLVLVRIFVAQIYFFSGYSKLYHVGPEWITADNMSRWLLLFHQQDQVRAFTEWGVWIADHPWIAFCVAASTVALDLAFILTPFFAAARRVLVPAAATFHVGILLVMGIAFLNAPQLLVFVNWDWLRSRVRGPAIPPVASTAEA